jgi:hypothetical protein
MVAALSGCIGNPYIHEATGIGSAGTLTLDGSKRTLVVNQKGTVCAEPSPDATATIVTEIAANLAAKRAGQGTDGSINPLNQGAVIEIFQRSQGVQVIRESMYRLCEAFSNGAIDGSAYADQLAALVVTLNFVVPFELCTKMAMQESTTGLKRPVVTDLVANACFDASLRFAQGGFDKFLLTKGVLPREPLPLSEKLSP